MTNNIRVTVHQAQQLAAQILQDHGAPAPSAHMQAELMVDGDLRGHPSHGLLRLPRIVRRIRSGVLDPAARGSFEWSRGALLHADGQKGLGGVIAVSALDAITERARTTGVAAAAIKNSNHLGMLAYYAERVARAGQILIATTTSEALVHPWHGTTALIGTNPLAIGVPALGEPFVFDMATGEISMGKIYAYAAVNRPLEPGWALGPDGQPTIDAETAKSGAIAPFGGPKGAGLAIALEVLVATLSGTALGTDVVGTLDDDQLSTKGDVFIVADAAPGLRERITAYLDEIRRSHRAHADTEITVPGDRSGLRKTAALQDGLTFPRELWKELSSLTTTKGTD